MPETNSPVLADSFGRSVSYLRLSVTDRCDFRCVYCMAEDMQFAPKSEVLSLEELHQVAAAFVGLGVRKIRITGGEPLVRSGIVQLLENIAALPGLDELVMTTNGSQLQRLAPALRNAGVSRLNISLDSLQARRFRRLTRHGNLDQVIAGIDAACSAGFDRIRINAVILKGRNEDEVLDLVAFARDRGIDIAFIEEMPLGNIDEHDRALTFISSADLRSSIEERHSLTELGDPDGAGGPARFYQLAGSVTRVGFISPHSNNFCHLCNRVRVTVEGRLLLCLGNEHSADLRAELRRRDANAQSLRAVIAQAMQSKPERHYFKTDGDTEIVRFMSATGG